MLRVLLVGLLLLVPQWAEAQTSYPMLVSLKPVAAQAGQASEHSLQSIHSMYGATQIVVTGTGVTGEVLTKMEPGKDGKPPNLQQIQVRFTVAPEARPGVRDFRIIGPTGPSTIGQLLVVSDPVVAEKDPNDTREQALPVTLPAVLCGTIEKGEDVDLFKFTVSEPSTWNFHVQAMRLEDKIHDLQTHVDPIITIRSANGSTIAAADNRYAADPLLRCRIEHPGEYFVEIRDVRYEGNPNWVYAVEANARPFVTTVFPPAVEPGTIASLQLNGWEPREAANVSWSVPAGLSAGIERFPLPGPNGPTNPVAVVINNLPPVLEATGDNNAPATGQKVAVPSGISGRIESDSDIDCYTFEAKKGDLLAIELISRRAGSMLDPIISILNDKGGRLIENDDLRAGNVLSQDAAIESWTVPADGNYTIEVRDLHLRGGTDFVYHLRLTRPEPTFTLTLDSDKTPIVPGGCTPIFVRVTRKNGFDGEIALDIEGLPAGVTATCGRIPKAAIDGAIILQADPSATGAPTNLVVRGRSGVKFGEEKLELIVQAQPLQEIYMPGGGRSHWPMELHTLALAPKSDLLSMKVTPSEVTLKPGESVTLDVEIVRAEGFDKNVTLDMVFQHLGGVFANPLPPGVKIDAKASLTALSAKETKGKIVLTADAKAAPVEKQLACVMGHVSINFVMKSATCSPPVWVTVAAP